MNPDTLLVLIGVAMGVPVGFGADMLRVFLKTWKKSLLVLPNAKTKELDFKWKRLRGRYPTLKAHGNEGAVPITGDHSYMGPNGQSAFLIETSEMLPFKVEHGTPVWPNGKLLCEALNDAREEKGFKVGRNATDDTVRYIFYGVVAVGLMLLPTLYFIVKEFA